MPQPGRGVPLRMRRPPAVAVDPLQRLIAGNDRFVAREPRRDELGVARLARPAESQRPFATILGCSDSRAPPELLFDQGFGDLFVVRVAGNIVSAEVLGSLQYAGAHLVTRLYAVPWGTRAAAR